MANEDAVKIVDLKVSVNCCEGCKRKVLKALSIKGILKTEIHPTLPKITITGNIQVPTLIKILAKSGKTVELWPVETSKAEREDSKSIINNKSNIEKEPKIEGGEKSSCKPPKTSSNLIDTNQLVDDKNRGDHKGTRETTVGDINEPQVTNSHLIYPTVVTTIPQQLNHSMIQNQTADMMPPCYRPIESYVVPMPYYTPLPCYYGLPVHQPPPMQPQATRFAAGDYFNDENTSGCHVM